MISERRIKRWREKPGGRVSGRIRKRLHKNSRDKRNEQETEWVRTDKLLNVKHRRESRVEDDTAAETRSF